MRLPVKISGLLLGPLLLCSCATENSTNSTRSGLPADVAMNVDAGCGGLLIVPLRLEDGETLPFVMDTGSPGTFLDESLEPKLGERLDTGTLWNFGQQHEMGLYAAPKLYLGNTLLQMTGTNIAAADCTWLTPSPRPPAKGIIGMDILSHYCVQLDFAARKLRFLDPAHLDVASLGRAFPLTMIAETDQTAPFPRPFIHCDGLMGGGETNLMIDTGRDNDGGLEPQAFQRAVREHQGDLTDEKIAEFAACVWAGGAYTNLVIGTWATNVVEPDALGLRFLARHLVTLDFPDRTLYLKRISAGFAVSADMNAEARAAAKSTVKILKRLQRNGRLPGWKKKDETTGENAVFHFTYPDSVTFDLPKKGDASLYHYRFVRATLDGPWELHGAWRTDQNDHTLEDYPVP